MRRRFVLTFPTASAVVATASLAAAVVAAASPAASWVATVLATTERPSVRRRSVFAIPIAVTDASAPGTTFAAASSHTAPNASIPKSAIALASRRLRHMPGSALASAARHLRRIHLRRPAFATATCRCLSYLRPAAATIAGM
jgi:hypothetical protein